MKNKKITMVIALILSFLGGIVLIILGLVYPQSVFVDEEIHFSHNAETFFRFSMTLVGCIFIAIFFIPTIKSFVDNLEFKEFVEETY